MISCVLCVCVCGCVCVCVYVCVWQTGMTWRMKGASGHRFPRSAVGRLMEMMLYSPDFDKSRTKEQVKEYENLRPADVEETWDTVDTDNPDSYLFVEQWAARRDKKSDRWYCFKYHWLGNYPSDKAVEAAKAHGISRADAPRFQDPEWATPQIVEQVLKIAVRALHFTLSHSFLIQI